VDESVVLLTLDQLANAHLLVESKVPVQYLSRRAGDTKNWYSWSNRFASGHFRCDSDRCPGSVIPT
jgi:hypothetical protein